MIIKKVNRNRFFEEIEKIDYRDQDKREAFEFGCFQGVVQCYKNADHFSAMYFVGYENKVPKLAYIIQRDGYLVFFIGKNVKNKISLIKAMRKESNKIIKRCGALRVNVASWYKEAKRFVELIGFKIWRKLDGITVYYKE